MKELLERMNRGLEKLFQKRWPLKAGEPKDLQMTLAQWLVYHQQEVHLKDNCSWMGIITYKNPLDIWIYQEIIHEVQPDVIVEIGSYAGGSTLFFAHMLDIIGKGIVVTIDIDRIVYEAEHPRIVTITGDSSSESVVGRVAELCEGRTVLVLHDGDHHAEQVIKDLRAYAPFVSVGSYLIVEDGISDQVRRGIGGGAFGDFPGGGPRAATREFLTECDDFIVDTSREHYILTYNPEGFLKRLR